MGRGITHRIARNNHPIELFRLNTSLAHQQASGNSSPYTDAASPMVLAKAALPSSLLLEGLALDLVPPDEVETRLEPADKLKQERDGMRSD